MRNLSKNTYSSAQPAKKVVIATKNIGANKPEDYGDYYTGEEYNQFGKGWHLPDASEIYALIEMTNKEWTGNGYKWTFLESNNHLEALKTDTTVSSLPLTVKRISWFL